MKVLHDWLRDYIGDALPAPQKVEELLTFHSFEIEGIEEVDGHSVIDVDVLPNRASDCLCHRGIARELAAIIDVDLLYDPLSQAPNLQSLESIDVFIEDEKACPRFTASLMRDVTVKASPQWLQNRLRALGQRPINNIVDATNYVMYAIGQPIHAYDADLFPQKDGTWQFGVRFARAEESVDLIAEKGDDDERAVVLEGDELLIVDRSSDTPAGLAGVKGGRYAGVHEGTKNIIIEAAHFDPSITRRTARKLGIVIDASKRFENEPSRELPPYAQRDVTELIAEIAGGTCVGFADTYLEKQEEIEVFLIPENANALLGLTLTSEEIQKLLERVGCTVRKEENTLVVTPPWERNDLRIPEDLIEEVGRIYGYEHVNTVIPERLSISEINAQHYYSEQIRHVLQGLGFSEVITSSFRKKDKIQLRNALASDKQYVRSALRKNINEALNRNIPNVDLLGLDDIRLFEIGTVFYKNEKGDNITEHVSVALGARAKQTGYSPKDDAVIAEAITELESVLGVAFDAHTEKGVAEFNLSKLLETLPEPSAYKTPIESPDIQYRPYSLYPFITRDVALWVGAGTDAKAVAEVIEKTAGELCVRVRLFDEYEKGDRISYAFRLVFQSDEKTLTDDEIQPFMEAIYKAAEAKNWEVR